MRDPMSGKSRGFGFVAFANQDEVGLFSEEFVKHVVHSQHASFFRSTRAWQPDRT